MGPVLPGRCRRRCSRKRTGVHLLHNADTSHSGQRGRAENTQCHYKSHNASLHTALGVRCAFTLEPHQSQNLASLRFKRLHLVQDNILVCTPGSEGTALLAPPT